MTQQEPRRVLLNGLAAQTKLIDLLVQNDIAEAETRLKNEQAHERSIERGGVINSVRIGWSSGKQGLIQSDLTNKRNWYASWREQAWQSIADTGGNVDYLQQKSLEACVNSYATAAGRYAYYQQFTILQNAILSPVYDGSLTDRQARFVSSKMGFKAERGEAVLTDTQRFINAVADDLGKNGSSVNTALVAGVTCAALMFMAAPHIGMLTGKMLGFQGAAAMSKGLAAWGCGSLAAGGFGMAGGIKVLLVGGGMVGSGVGYAFAQNLCRLPSEAVTVSLAKFLNFVRYLDSLQGTERATEAAILRKEIVDEFLEAKSRLERDGLSGGMASSEGVAVRDNIRIMNTALLQLVPVSPLTNRF